MSLLLLGISHHTAPIEQRERLAVSAGLLPDALQRLAQQPGVREGLILSTCNRVEVLVDADERLKAGDLLAFLAGATGCRPMPPESGFYQLAGEAVARHLFRVASSLDSLIVGEPQILGQLKQAFAAAQIAGGIGPELDAVLTRAFHAAKRVRSETAIASHPVSVSQAAVDLARQIFGDLRQKAILLVGAGEMGEATVRYLMRQGATRLLVSNRSLVRAQALAEKCGGEAFPLEELRARGEMADIILTCTGSPQPLISRADAAFFLARRHGRPVLFLDIAVPRDVDPDVHQLDNAFVYNVDDLDRVVHSNLEERQQEAAAGEAIVEAELALYLQRRRERDVTPTLRALQAHAEALRLAEWERIRKRLGPLTPEQEQMVEALTRSLMQKWLHRPLVELKGSGAGSQQAVEAAERLFGLNGTKPNERPSTTAVESAREDTLEEQPPVRATSAEV